MFGSDSQQQLKGESSDYGHSAQPGTVKVYSVPRRYDLATLFAVTLAYGLLFGVLKICQVPPIAILLVAGFVTLIGLAQAFITTSPRAASVAIGIVCVAVANVPYAVDISRRHLPHELVFIGVIGVLVCSLTGVVLGYVTGVFVGGVFLVADYGRAGLKRLSTRRPV